MNCQLVPFGKYKGQPIEVLQSDQGYCEWLMAQDWFKERYPKLITVIVNNFGQPEDTPEHNSLQAKFLDADFSDKLIKYLFRNAKYGKYYGFECNEFEVKGWDVRLGYSYMKTTKIEIEYEEIPIEKLVYGDLYIEIKPNVGDDYPSILRQMKSNEKSVNKYGLYRGSNEHFILIYDSFTALGATEEQVKQTFHASNYLMVSFNAIENWKEGDANETDNQ